MPDNIQQDTAELDAIKTHFIVAETGETAWALLDEQAKAAIIQWADKRAEAARIDELERIIAAYDMSGALFFTQTDSGETISLSDRIAALTSKADKEVM